MRRTLKVARAISFPTLASLCLLSARGVEPLTDPSPAAPSFSENAAQIVTAEKKARKAETAGDFPAEANALNDEADARLRAGEFDAAEKLRLRVVDLREKGAGRDSVGVSDALLSLGWFYANRAQYEQAQAALDRSHFLRLRRLGADSIGVAEVLNALGSLEENRGNLELAQGFYEQALVIQEKKLGLESTTTANTWNNLATLDWVMGDYAAAQRLFNQALRVREKKLGRDSAVVAKTLNNLALLDVSLGAYDEAESYFQRVLRIRTAQLGPTHPATLTTLSQLGLLYVRKGEDARAEPLLARAVSEEERLSPENNPDLARALAELAVLHDRRREYALAGPLLERALKTRRQVLGPRHTETASSLADLARHQHAQGELSAALPLYREALDVDNDVLGPNHPETLAVTGDLALLELELRQPNEATRLAREAGQGQQAMLNGVFGFTAEQRRIAFQRTLEPCDLPAALADADLMAEMVLRTKGVVLDSLLEDEAASRAEEDPEVRDLMEKRRGLMAQVAQIESEKGEPGPAARPDSEAQRRRLDGEILELEKRLADRGVASGETRRALLTEVSDVREALPGDAALVEFVSYRRYTGRLTSVPWYGAVVLTRDAPSVWVPLGSAAEIDGRVRLEQKYMARRVREVTVRGVLRGLFTSLCQPVIQVLPEGVHRLILCPDGQLNFVSFATLLDADDRFLASRYEINYVSSGRDLLRKLIQTPPSKQIVVFAHPDYEHLPGSSATIAGKKTRPDLLELAPLPGTEQEARFLQAEARRSGLETQIYRGLEASKANLAKVDSPYVLHLATHGFYLNPEDVPLLPPAGGAEAVTADAYAMQRSVLALTGAGRTLRDWGARLFPAPENDGLLTAQQAAALKLDRTWLVALSACDTGRGEAQAGEGVFGLRRGFAEAGAQNLLMTLWTTDDEETVALMQAFYREALRTGDAPGALARAQRTSLETVRRKSGLAEAARKAGPFVLSW